MFVDSDTDKSRYIPKISKSLFKTFAVTQLWTYLDVASLDLAGDDLGSKTVNDIVKDVR